MLDICITFDYELFFGENNATYDEILFHPTEELLKVLSSESTTSTFFVDIYSYVRHNELLGNEYCKKFANQLEKMIFSGQDVQLHIHPHWIYSDYANGKWTFDNNFYRIQDFGYDENSEVSAADIVSQGIAALKDILGNNYNCIAFRAGGLSIQPERELIEILCNNGILIDASIAPGMRTIGGNTGYDFRNVPRKVLNWHISSLGGINNDAAALMGKVLFEVPIGTIRNNIFRMLSISPKKWRLNIKNVKGSFFQEKNPKLIYKYIRKIQTLYRRLCGVSMISLDTKGYELMVKELDAIYKKYNCCKKDSAVSIICHPKMLTDDSLKNIQNLIVCVKRQPDKYKFCNMNDITRKYC